MPLSIFIDALPFSEVSAQYYNMFEDEQIALIIPNIAYSSVLHWQLYCNKYPDERGKFVDWKKTPEKNKAIVLLSSLLRPIDYLKPLSFFVRKFLDRFIFRRNAFANIPFKFRKFFSEESEYLFWNKKTYSKEKIFEGYDVISQDEGHLDFFQTLALFNEHFANGSNKNLFLSIGEIDHQGHICARGPQYTESIKKYMDQIRTLVAKYIKTYPSEEVLIVSDHGMSTIYKFIDFKMEKHFGRQSNNNYIAYCDSCIMCVWCDDKEKLHNIQAFLSKREEGHLLSEKERNYYKVTNKDFGDLIYILNEGFCFKSSWFGMSIRKHPNGQGMHGFWPVSSSNDQMASIILINSNRTLQKQYNYREASLLIKEVMANNL